MSANTKRLILGVVAAVFALMATASSVEASLSDLLNQKSLLRQKAEESQQKIAESKRESRQLKELIEDLDTDIQGVSGRIAATEEEVDLTAKIIASLNQETRQKQAELDELNQKLRSAYVTLYELSQSGYLIELVGSDSLSDLVTRMQYVEAVQATISRDIERLNKIKRELDEKLTSTTDQKTDLERLSERLRRSKIELSGKRSEKNTLLKQTNGEQTRYEELLKQLAADQEQLDKQIYEERRKQLGKGETYSGGSSAYPWPNEPNPAAVDPWLFFKRQCVSYTAWKFQAVYGQAFINTRPGQGSGWNWPALARDQGYKTSSIPTVGAVVSWPTGPGRPYGHTAWVEAINNDGTINVSEYNWVIERGYSERKNVNPEQYGTPTYITP